MVSDRDSASVLAAPASLAREVATSSPPAARRTVVLGFSQGAHTASRWVVLGRRNVHELVLWGAGLAADLTLDALAAGLDGVHVTFVRGARDKFRDRREEEAQDALLEEPGVSFRALVHAGEHEIAPAPLLDLASERPD